MKSFRTWAITSITFIILFLVLLGSITIIIDPFFHYHTPISSLAYPMITQRYQNDGITRHFDYDAIITGTSMTENFKTSEFDTLFNAKSIKIPFSGGEYKEINNAIERAMTYNDNIKYVVRCLDADSFDMDKDEMAHDNYPDYLYDQNLFNDIQYILNKDVLFNSSLYVFRYTNWGYHTPTFDEYSAWSHKYQFGKEAILKDYKRVTQRDTSKTLDASTRKRIEDNIYQNAISIALDHPDTKFYYFISPYSILFWDQQNRRNLVEYQIAVEEYVIELLLGYNNIYIFSFNDQYDIISNLDNYKDYIHYHGNINSQILQWMHDGYGQLTKENYRSFYNHIRDYYLSYNYDAIYQ